MQRSTSLLTFLAFGACTYNPDLVAGETGTGDTTTAGETANPGPGASTAETADTSGAGPTTDPTSAGSSGPSDSSGPGEESSTGLPAVPCAGSCVTPATGEWTGPFRLETSDADAPGPICGDGWDLAVGPELFGGIVAPSAECECSCGAAQGVTCTGATRTLYSFDSPFVVNCIFAEEDETYQLTPGQCLNISPARSNSRWRHVGVNPAPQGGSCLATESSDVEAAAFSTRYTLCGEAEPESGDCDEGGQCTTATEVPLCIVAEGDLECPGDGFDVKHVVYTELTDTRDCSECSCGAPQGTCSEPELLLRPGSCPMLGDLGTTPPDPEILTPGQCITVPGSIGRVNYPSATAPQPTTTCIPTAPTPTGEATGQGTTTLCCTG